MDKKPVVRALERGEERSFSHPYNPRSQLHGVSLGDRAGLKRIGVHALRIPPGKESFEYHSHLGEEEWMYVLSGRGVIEIDGVEHELGPGDFVGFGAPSPAHQLRNPHAEDLNYLSGGERHEMEIADFPRQKKRLARVGRSGSVHSLESAEELPPLKKL